MPYFVGYNLLTLAAAIFVGWLCAKRLERSTVSAFVAETLTRVGELLFFAMVGIATGIGMLLAYVFFSFYKKKWDKFSKVGRI